MKKNAQTGKKSNNKYDLNSLTQISLQNNKKLISDIEKFKKTTKKEEFDFIDKYLKNISKNDLEITHSSDNVNQKLNLKKIEAQYDVDLLETKISDIFQKNSFKSFFEKYDFTDSEAAELIEYEKVFQNKKEEKVDLTKTTRIILNKIKI